MADVARCLCPHDFKAVRCGLNQCCPIHGWSAPTPRGTYRLSEPDRRMLKSFRIAVDDSEAIEDVRKAEEQRFNPPRIQP